MNSRVIVQIVTATILCGIGAAGWAATVQLKKGTVITGEVLQVQDDQVVIGVPRESIATINGTPLAAALNEGGAAPAFTATDLNGTVQSVGPGKAKVTLLHFWVHWCPHCRSDAATVQTLYSQYRDNPQVKIVTVNLDQDQAKVAEFVKTRQVTYPVIVAAAAKTSGGPDLPELYQITAFPVTFLIDGQGMIRHKQRGSFVESNTDLDAQIRQLLAAS